MAQFKPSRRDKFNPAKQATLMWLTTLRNTHKARIKNLYFELHNLRQYIRILSQTMESCRGSEKLAAGLTTMQRTSFDEAVKRTKCLIGPIISETTKQYAGVKAAIGREVASHQKNILKVKEALKQDEIKHPTGGFSIVRKKQITPTQGTSPHES